MSSNVISKTIKKNIIVFFSFVFLGKLVFSIYSNFFIIPEQKLIELQQKTNHFIVFKHNSINEWKRKIQISPLYTIKTLDDSQIIEEYVYTNVDKQFIDSISLEEFNPFYYHIKIQSNELNTLNVYFYKKLFSLPVVFGIFYDSILWTFFLALAIIAILFIFYLIAFGFYELKLILNYFFEKKIQKNLYQ